MDLSLNDTQRLIQDSARDFVRGACGRDVLLDLDRNPSGIMAKLWPQMCELGWTGMAIPEAYGGTGNSLTDLAVLFEELGTAPVPGPLFSSAVLCARILLESATEDTKESWLPQIAEGRRVFALALTEAQYGWSLDTIRTRATEDAGGFLLNGTKVFVFDALYATDLLVAARVEGVGGVGLFRVDVETAGVAVRRLEGFLTGLCEVTLENVRVSRVNRFTGDATGTTLDRAMLAAAPVLCAYKVGGCRSVFDTSVNYARERTQFGQVIGRFQRVQDHVIHIVNYLDAARWTTYEALWKLDTGATDAATSVHVAKSVSSESYMRACDFAHEVHAGIGVVREYGLTLHTKMSRSLYHCLGAPREHRKRLESTLGLVPS
jgi:alkylation response protein AidB-like acyl-CoA dehydrogenase